MVVMACGQNTPTEIDVAIEKEYDFILHLDDAEIEGLPKGVFPSFYTINDDPRWCIYQHPRSRITYSDVYIGQNAKLMFGFGIREECWDKGGDGVKFRISLEASGEEVNGGKKVLFEEYINPKENFEDRKWHQRELNIAEYKNQSVSIIYETLPGKDDADKNITNDWAVWSNPMLVSDGKQDTHKSHDRTNIVLLVVDTLRADYLNCYGKDWIKTPNIDQIARDGVLFEKAYAPMSTTAPSHASIFTSLFPYQHGVITNEYHLAEKIPRLTDVLIESGYKTGAAISVFHLNDVLSGLGDGFDFYEQVDPAWSGERGISDLGVYTRPASITMSGAIEWLDEVHNDPFFLWIHTYDPHIPYMGEGDYHKMYYEGDPNDPSHTMMEDVMFNKGWGPEILSWCRACRDLDYYKREYAAEISYVDNQVGRLIQNLKRLGVYENTLIVLTSDHGENLGEHNVYFDHWFLYETDLHVPLIYHYPKELPKSVRVKNDVSIVDIAPTMLDIIGEAIHPIAQNCFEGSSLRPFWTGPAENDGIVYAEGLNYTEVAAWDDRYKVIWELKSTEYNARLQLYEDRVKIFDRVNDPNEIDPIGSFMWGRYLDPPTQYKEGEHTPAFVKQEALEDESFLPRIVALLEILRKKVVPPPVTEVIKQLGDISSMTDVELNSLPVSDPSFIEALEDLGYTGGVKHEQLDSQKSEKEIDLRARIEIAKERAQMMKVPSEEDLKRLLTGEL